MVITISMIAFLLCGILLLAKWHDMENWTFGLGLSATLVGSIGLIFCICLIIAAPISVQGYLAEYNSIQQTMDRMRETGTSELERAAIQQQVFDFNRDLAKKKWTATNPWLNWFQSSRVLDLTPIK